MHWQELERSGVTAAQARAMLGTGALARVRRGVYATRATDSVTEQHERLLRATWPALKPGAVISHFSAAAHRGRPVPDNRLDRLWITRTGSSGGMARHGVLRLVRWPLAECDIEEITVTHDIGPSLSVSITSPARTLADTARGLSLAEAVVLADHALRTGVLREEALDILIVEARRRGSATARRALLFADPLAESPGESRSRVLMDQFGLPRPVLQHELFDHDGLIGRGDFAWLKQRVIGEFDGRVKYSAGLSPGGDPSEAVWREKQREDRARRAGWTFVRWTWNDLFAPEQLAKRWWDALR